MTREEERAQKLLALVKRGVGGEVANADKLLQRLLRRTGIRLEDIDDERQVRRMFTFTTKEHRMFVLQCIASVIGSTGRSYTTKRGERGTLYVELNTAEHLECDIRIEHYWSAWKREREAFYDAFIQANRLFAKNSKSAEPVVLSPEELKRIRRIMELMDAARVEGPHKLLERPEKLTAHQ